MSVVTVARTPVAARPPKAEARREAERSEALGNPIGSNLSAPDTDTAGQDRRDRAWQMRTRLWELSTLKNVRACGRHPVAENVRLRLPRDGKGRAGFAGLQSCGCPWACPPCARKIAARRAEELAALLDAHFAAGGGATLVTFTARHRLGQALAMLWAVIMYAWSKVSSGRGYAADAARFGIIGWHRVTEVTHGFLFGWHPHLHVVFLTDTPISQELAECLGERLWDRWEAALGRKGLTAVAHRGGLDVRVIDHTLSGRALGDYLHKVAFEAVGGPGKAGRGGNRSPFEVFADFLATGLVDDYELWVEWEKVSAGHRQVGWSKGLRERYRLGPEETDEQIANTDAGGEDEIELPASTWRQVRDRAWELLRAAEDGGAEGAARWLDARGLAWSWVQRSGFEGPPLRRAGP